MKLEDLKITCKENNWNVSCTPEIDSDEIRLRIRGRREGRGVIPECTVSFLVPHTGILYRWTPETNRIPSLLRSPFESGCVLYVPIVSLYGAGGRNRLTLSLLDPKCETQILCARPSGSESSLKMEISLFRSGDDRSGSEFEVVLRLDCRPILWSQAVREAVADYEKRFPPMFVPDSAFQPFYSSWYAYFQAVTDDIVEKECRIARSLGMQTVIQDDGWQTPNYRDWWHDCGSWEICREKFPDMAAHVRRVHEIGMKYLIWFAIPFVGRENPLFETMRGKFLRCRPQHAVYILDPRYPDVREHLASLLEHAMKEWGVDGFKLDYLEQFRKLKSDFSAQGGMNGEQDLTVLEEAPGRDTDSVADALEKLMREIRTRLTALNPEVMLEFRQTYIGPVMRQFGNLMRAGDCPNDVLSNRNRYVLLRLTSGGSAVHSDMLAWNTADTVENAAMQLLNAFFAVPQVSVRLAELPPAHRNMLDFYLHFMGRHADTLYRSDFLPGPMEENIPWCAAESEGERITVVYNAGIFTEAAMERTHYLINATGAAGLVAAPSAPCRAEIYTPEGTLCRTLDLPAGFVRLPVPCAGMAILKRKA